VTIIFVSPLPQPARADGRGEFTPSNRSCPRLLPTSEERSTIWHHFGIRCNRLNIRARCRTEVCNGITCWQLFASGRRFSSRFIVTGHNELAGTLEKRCWMPNLAFLSSYEKAAPVTIPDDPTLFGLTLTPFDTRDSFHLVGLSLLSSIHGSKYSRWPASRPLHGHPFRQVHSKANSPTEKPNDDVAYELPSYLLWLESGKDDFLESVVWCGSKGPLEPV